MWYIILCLMCSTGAFVATTIAAMGVLDNTQLMTPQFKTVVTLAAAVAMFVLVAKSMLA